MQILHIPASEVMLGDILGEGMVVWLIAKSSNQVSLFWGGDGACWMNATMDEMHMMTWQSDDIVKVIRS